ncbi:MAG: tetraacyldisaccharide 4'-kinase [Flavobacteriales bacterium CG_4_10_14_0_2_um_filter_32_8]|nr:MAG: tetraacyldisaccharide 4'-kinase [Flavobacteriales bacterium CG_4_10_14_0_2_um_filter_32_8]PJB14734.1 MAG: tetraacyldisaccharide 4'-kinase [Flavobacteriales bacterium CG_4_9_14_3_um_filter_32_8]
MKKILNILLFPFSLFYGSIVYFRNKLYDWNILTAKEFNFPVISVGNLAMGGVGKTPHVEYLINLLKNDFRVATLSRGYKRTTSGFYLADNHSTSIDLGDEPLQFKNKFENLIVAVDEKRVSGINKLKELHPEINVILLDDAYQHRSVTPGINILVTDFSNLYINDTIVPSGRLREWAFGSKRADIIIVSKTSAVLSPIDKRRIKESLNPEDYQKIYFSYLKYGEITPFTEAAKNLTDTIGNNFSILLLTGIAKAGLLFYKLYHEFNIVEHFKFADHHNYTESDVIIIKERFKNLFGNNKIIITTEKDIMRLSLPKIKDLIQDIPIFYIPIEICFHGNDKVEFDEQILKYVKANSRN